MTVDRSINDIIPVDDALNESMLNSNILRDNIDTGNDEANAGNNETTDISNEWTSENSNTKDDGDRKPPRGHDLARGKEEVE